MPGPPGDSADAFSRLSVISGVGGDYVHEDSDVAELLAQAADAHALALGGSASGRGDASASDAPKAQGAHALERAESAADAGGLEGSLSARLAALSADGDDSGDAFASLGARLGALKRSHAPASGPENMDALVTRFEALKACAADGSGDSADATPPSRGQPTVDDTGHSTDVAVGAVLAAAEAEAAADARSRGGCAELTDAELITAALGAPTRATHRGREQARAICGSGGRALPHTHAHVHDGCALESDGYSSEEASEGEDVAAVMRWAADAARLDELVEARGDDSLLHGLLPEAPRRPPER